MKKTSLFLGLILVGGLGWWAYRTLFFRTPLPSFVVSQAEAPQELLPEEVLSQDEDVPDMPESEEKTPIATLSPESSSDSITKPPVKTPTKSAATGKLGIQEKLVDFGFTKSSKKRLIDTIILHSSYDAFGSDPYSLEGVLAIWKSYGVSPHYVIDRKGMIYRLVKDENIAYHAGVAKVPDGRTAVNDFSIGIEILNTKTDEYAKDQYDATRKLIASLKKQYAIKYVLGHNDIAPGRKTDPWNFDWKKLK